jgi:hypothetical protein
VPRFRPTDRRDALRSLLIIALFVLVILAVSVWIKPKHGTVYSIILVIAMFYMLVAFNSRAYGYRCTNCGHQYQVRPFLNFFTPASVSKNPDGTYVASKWLVCPKCGKRAKAIVLRKADYTGTGNLLKERGRR